MPGISSSRKHSVPQSIRIHSLRLVLLAKAIKEWGGDDWDKKHIKEFLKHLKKNPVPGLDLQLLQAYTNSHYNTWKAFWLSYSKDPEGTCRGYGYTINGEPLEQEQVPPAEVAALKPGFLSPLRVPLQSPSHEFVNDNSIRPSPQLHHHEFSGIVGQATVVEDGRPHSPRLPHEPTAPADNQINHLWCWENLRVSENETTLPFTPVAQPLATGSAWQALERPPLVFGQANAPSGFRPVRPGCPINFGPADIELVPLVCAVDPSTAAPLFGGFQSPLRAHFRQEANVVPPPPDRVIPSVSVVVEKAPQHVRRQPPRKAKKHVPAFAPLQDPVVLKEHLPPALENLERLSQRSQMDLLVKDFKTFAYEGMLLEDGLKLGTFLAHGSNSVVYHLKTLKMTHECVLWVPLLVESREEVESIATLFETLRGVSQVAGILSKVPVEIGHYRGLVVEKVRFGTISDWVENRSPQGLQASIAACFLFDLALAMRAFELNNLGHGDAHPANLMLDVDMETADFKYLLQCLAHRKPILKVIDLGSMVPLGVVRRTDCPMLSNGKREVTAAGEVFAFGADGVFLITGITTLGPFWKQLLEDHTFDDSYKPLVDLLSKCLAVEPDPLEVDLGEEPVALPTFVEILASLKIYLNTCAAAVGEKTRITFDSDLNSRYRAPFDHVGPPLPCPVGC